jgi:hypothetical protein
MNRVDESLASILSLLTKTSTSILTNALPLMKMLVDDGNDLCDEIIHNLQLPDDKISVVNKWLQNYVEELISTAKSLRPEIAKFQSSWQKGDEALDKNMKDYPILAEAWYGDTYNNNEGIPAFELLLKELESDLSNLTENKIIERACKYKFE